ncbi:MAG: HPr family phosphocarrier protein [Acidobacteriota bacterium]|nr:HPr family phosphocarrier protein [Acidobacteriota bacterium]
MLESEIKVCNPLGLHARAAAQLVRLASGFKSKIKLRRTDNHVVADAKSILSVLTLAASKGVMLKIEVEGKDESEAMQAIEEIFRKNFGEI